jgi:hypothetical protein
MNIFLTWTVVGLGFNSLSLKVWLDWNFQAVWKSRFKGSSHHLGLIFWNWIVQNSSAHCTILNVWLEMFNWMISTIMDVGTYIWIDFLKGNAGHYLWPPSLFSFHSPPVGSSEGRPQSHSRNLDLGWKIPSTIPLLPPTPLRSFFPLHPTSPASMKQHLSRIKL